MADLLTCQHILHGLQLGQLLQQNVEVLSSTDGQLYCNLRGDLRLDLIGKLGMLCGQSYTLFPYLILPIPLAAAGSRLLGPLAPAAHPPPARRP